MVTYSSTLAGIIPWIEEPGQSMGSQRQTRLSMHAHTHAFIINAQLNHSD